jgi:Signal transduction histidine kinase
MAKNKEYSFFSIVVLALALIALFVVTQFFTNKSTRALNEGNKQAVATFLINNSIQELVNLSFDLQSKFKDRNLKVNSTRISQLKDSLTMLGYNTDIITSYTSSNSHEISNIIRNIIEEQLNISESILNTHISGNVQEKNKLIDSLYKVSPGDKVYANCLTLQAFLRKNLQETLTRNSEQAGQLSLYNKILALFAIITILVMSTIIIKRQSQQLKLIAELQAAEQAALKSKNAKDEFLANMSHELRTPLNALIGFGNLLKDTPLNKQQREYVDMVRSGAQNLLNIVNDVLDLSKIEAGKLKMVHKPFNLYHLFNRLERMFSNAINEKGLHYSSYIESKVPEHVIGDSERLQQIFVNLIGNAIKFTNEGEIKVTANVVWIDEDDKYYKLGFTVKDTGIGIPKDKVAAIFERFEQLEQGVQRQYGGTGLGLTIAKNLVERMGGTISVFSEVNEGSEFNFTCILEKNTNPVSEEQSFITIDKLPEGKVLIVEDNKANQILLKHMFGKYGLKPKIIDNGLEAVNLLEKETFDLIFMDIQMPEMDGYTAIGILRNEKQISTPIIAMTAYVSETEIIKCKNAGFTDYISKPVDEQLLIKTTASYLENIQNNNHHTLNYLYELVGNDPDTVGEVVQAMKNQWELDKAELIEAFSQQDIEKVKKILHRLKSTFSPLGAEHPVYKAIGKYNFTTMENKTLDLQQCTSFIEDIEKEINV